MLADVRYHVTLCQPLALHNIKKLVVLFGCLVEMIFFFLVLFSFAFVDSMPR